MSKKNNLADSGLKKLCSFLVLAASQGQLINDTLQAQDKVFSSKHVTDLINSMSEQDKKYVDDIVANLNKLSSKTTNVIPDSSNAEPNTLYLYSADPNPTSYNQYMVLSDKTILDLGTTNISLEGYLKEVDADGKYLKQVDAHSHDNKSTIDNLTQNVIDNINNLNVEVDGVSYTQDRDGKIALPNYPVPRTDDEIKTLADGQIESSKQVLQFSDLKGITADSTLDEVVRAVPGCKIAILQSALFTNYLGLPHQMYTITINSLGYNRMQVFATSKYSDHDSYVGACNNSSGVDVYDKWIKVITDKHVTTTINSSSTDTQVPSAKSVYTIVSDVKFCNPNLLDNPFFTVNQRGKTSYTSGGYTVDRWKIYSTDGLTVTINSDGSLTITNTTTTANKHFGQILNRDIANKLKGRRFTLSVDGYGTSDKITMYPFYTSDKGNGAMTKYGNNYINTERAIYSCVYKFPDLDVNLCEILTLSIPAGESLTIYSAKVELDEVSTLKNEEVPDYNKELLRCQISTADSSDTYANRHIYTTKVADVPLTQLTMGSGVSGSVSYYVKNGICYVQVNGLKSSTMSTSGQIMTSGLPVPEVITEAYYPLIANDYTKGCLLVAVKDTGKMVNHVGVNNASYYGAFSYPVAES